MLQRVEKWSWRFTVFCVPCCEFNFRPLPEPLPREFTFTLFDSFHWRLNLPPWNSRYTDSNSKHPSRYAFRRIINVFLRSQLEWRLQNYELTMSQLVVICASFCWSDMKESDNTETYLEPFLSYASVPNAFRHAKYASSHHPFSCRLWKLYIYSCCSERSV